MDVFRQGAKVGQPIIMFRPATPTRRRTSPSPSRVGVGVLRRRAASAALTLHYANDIAFELEYSPNGVDSGLCVGTARTAIQREGHPPAVRRLGQDRLDLDADDISVAAFLPVRPAINGSDTNFSHPFVLTYPQNGNPTDKPRPQLVPRT